MGELEGDEVESALAHATWRDPDPHIRRMARWLHGQKPRRRSIEEYDRPRVPPEDNAISRRRRVARFEIVSSGINTRIEIELGPPGIDWKKVIGSSDIGAEFGLSFNALAEMLFSLLKSRFAVSAVGKAYGKFNLGK